MNRIQGAKTNPKIFAELYDENVKGIYQYLISRTQSQKDAEDLTSTVWELAFKNIKNLNGDHPQVFKTWLYTIARNELNHFYTKKINSKQETLEEKHEQISNDEPSPQETSEQKEDIALMRELISALPDQQRETIALHFFSELKNKEIAELQNLSEKTVASNLSRALQTLRTRWKSCSKTKSSFSL